MTVAQQRLTLADYLSQAPTDKRYELVNGELIEMPADSDINQRIVMFLLAYFLGQSVHHYCLRIGLEINDEPLQSALLPTLELTAQQVLAG